MKKVFSLLRKYEELITYLIVGVMTTVVSWGAYALLKLVLDVSALLQMQLAVILRWCAGVAFAYVTNRRFVFKSRNPNILAEFVGFTSSRVTTLLVEMFIMWLLPSVFGVNDWIATLLSAVLVTVLNYVFSKFLVFKK